MLPPGAVRPSLIALTLRAVGGLRTAQIASAFLVPEATMAQRISRAKQTIRTSRLPFAMPEPAERAERLRAVLHVLYLIFNEGYTTAAGPELTAPHLSEEAIRLTRWLQRLLPDHGEVAGLLALMMITDARSPARIVPDGTPVPLPDQDRSRWNRALIAEGVGLVTRALSRGDLGPYQVQAAIAAVHDEARDAEATDWPQILGLYQMLERLAPNPMATLNRAVAVAHVHGPTAGLDLVAELEADPRIARHHRLHASRAYLLELAGEPTLAATVYRDAARRTTSHPALPPGSGAMVGPHGHVTSSGSCGDHHHGCVHACCCG